MATTKTVDIKRHTQPLPPAVLAALVSVGSTGDAATNGDTSVGDDAWGSGDGVAGKQTVGDGSGLMALVGVDAVGCVIIDSVVGGGESSSIGWPKTD